MNYGYKESVYGKSRLDLYFNFPRESEEREEDN